MHTYAHMYVPSAWALATYPAASGAIITGSDLIFGGMAAGLLFLAAAALLMPYKLTLRAPTNGSTSGSTSGSTRGSTSAEGAGVEGEEVCPTEGVALEGRTSCAREEHPKAGLASAATAMAPEVASIGACPGRRTCSGTSTGPRRTLGLGSRQVAQRVVELVRPVDTFRKLEGD